MGTAVTYKVEPVEFGQAVTPVTGKTLINGVDYAVAITVEKITGLEDGSATAESVVMTMTLDQAAEMAKDLHDAVAQGRFKQFISKPRKVLP